MSKRRGASSSSSSSDDGGSDLERTESKLHKLKRLASDPNYKSSLSFGVDSEEISTPPPSHNAAASVLNGMLQGNGEKRGSMHHANIRIFVEKEYHKSTASKELIRHLIFVVILIAGVTLHRSAFESYLMNQALITSFVTEEIEFDLQPFPKDFHDIGQPDEFADWLVSVVGGTLDSDTFYSGRNKTDAEKDYVMFSNRLLGGIRLRQLRAAPNKSCKVPNMLKKTTNTCYAYDYSVANRATAPFGPEHNRSKYTYSSMKTTGSVQIIGYVLDFLEGGGYTVDLDLDKRDKGITFTEQLQELVDDTWVDEATRAVIISMVFLNLELESRVSVLYLILEVPGNGVFFPSFMIKTFRLNLYVVPLDYFRLFLEIIFVLFTLYAIYSEIYEMVNNHRTGGKGLKKYFYNGWNLIELVDIVLYITVIALYCKYLLAPERTDAKLDSRFYSADMEQLAASALIFYNICAINVILTTFRTFKYLRLNHRLYLLWKTLRHAGADLIGFLFIFLIFIFGFIFMGWLSFGSDMEEFNTFVHSFSTCWTFIIGSSPDYNEMFRSNRILGPTFYVLFTIFIFFILANMFIAILSNSFEVVNENIEDEGKLKDIIEEKISEMVGNVRNLFYQMTKKEDVNYTKRNILHLLDNLACPEALEIPNVTREDIARAIGPSATHGEIEDLYKWTKKLEAKKSKKTKDRSSTKNLMSSTEDEEEKTKTLTKQQIAEIFQQGSPSMDQDTKDVLRDLQNQMKEMRDLVHTMYKNNGNVSSSSINNNNNK